MRFKSGMAVSAIMSMAIIAGPLLGQKTIEEIITRVNGDIILRSEYDARVAQIRQQLAQQQLQGPQLEQAVATQTRDLLRDLIDEKLMVQVAGELGLNADLDVIRALERMRQENNLASLEDLEQAMTQQGYNVDDVKNKLRNDILTGQVLQREVYYKVTVTTEDKRAYYDANTSQFDKPQGLRLREIVVLTEKKTPAEA
jgi:parvulin-like peptidyl-prolyl isomerase